MKNWWYYHKWYVICGLLLCVLAVWWIGSALGLFQKSPDLQIAYVGATVLSEDTAAAVEKAFSSFAGDYNKDGQIIVQINQYVSIHSGDNSPEAAGYRQAAELKLIADINDCESYFFLLEKPEDFQRQYQILANEDGSCPDSSDISIDNKALLWSSFSSLSGIEPDALSSFYLGRRCFYDEKEADNAKDCAALWNTLKGDSD